MKTSFKITSPYGELRGVLDEEELLNEEVEWQVIESYCNLFNLSIQKATREKREGVAVWKVVAFDRDTSQVYEVRAEFNY